MAQVDKIPSPNMRVRFTLINGAEVDMECKSAYPVAGFLVIRLSEAETMMVPEHIIDSTVRISDPEWIKKYVVRNIEEREAQDEAPSVAPDAP